MRASPYGGKGPVMPAANGSAETRPGDWMCASCGNHNYAKRVQCNKCQAPKPFNAGNQNFGQGNQNFGQGNQTIMEVGRALAVQMGFGNAAAQMMSGNGPNMLPGDCMCRACGNHNFASRDKCNKCQMPEDVFIAKTGFKEGDWVCSSCSNHNFADKESCNKCQLPKAQASAPVTNLPSMIKGNGKGNLRPGDWVCGACQNHNFANREVCNKCAAPKQ